MQASEERILASKAPSSELSSCQVGEGIVAVKYLDTRLRAAGDLDKTLG
jgi:hypothetical protein